MQESYCSVSAGAAARIRWHGSKKDAYDDLCAVNDANGSDARRRSRRLEDQQSPTSVAAPDVYGAEKRLPRRDDDDALHEQCVDDLLAQFRANASRKK